MRPGRVRIQGQVPAEGPRGQNRTERGGDPGSMVLALSPGSTVLLQESGSKELSLGGSENGAFSLFFYIIKVIVCCKINPDKGEVSQAK